MSYAPKLHCSHPGCEATLNDDRWSKIKAAGWFHSRDDSQIFCPDHLPEWVPSWRARKQLASTEDD